MSCRHEEENLPDGLVLKLTEKQSLRHPPCLSLQWFSFHTFVFWGLQTRMNEKHLLPFRTGLLPVLGFEIYQRINL